MPQHGQELVLGFVLCLGGFACLRLIAQQALSFAFCGVAELALCFEQVAGPDQFMIQCIDFFDATVFNVGLLAAPERHG